VRRKRPAGMVVQKSVPLASESWSEVSCLG